MSESVEIEITNKGTTSRGEVIAPAVALVESVDESYGRLALVNLYRGDAFAAAVTIGLADTGELVVNVSAQGPGNSPLSVNVVPERPFERWLTIPSKV